MYGMEIRNGQQDPLSRRLAGTGLSYTGAAVLPVLLSFLLSLVVAAAGGSTDADWVKYCSYLIPQLSFAAVCILFFVKTGTPVKPMYSRCEIKYFILALLMQFGLLFSLSELNVCFVNFLESFGYKSALSDTLPDLTGWRAIPAIVVIALLPALFEELLFRGILLRGMKESGWGTAASVLICGALFSLFHGNPEQTLYQFVCGMCFALLSLRAGSVLPTVLSHFLNNAVILILTSLFGADFSPTGNAAVVLTVLSALSFAAALVWLLVFDRKKNTKGGVRDGKTFFSAAAVGIIVCLLEWIYVLASGFANG